MAIAVAAFSAIAADTPPPPERLSETGLYVPGTREIAPGNIAYEPQYPLWTDGATKRRWFYLPPGTAIDASDPDAWQFPPGTRLWKEFSHGRPMETRFIERLEDGSWRFAVYAWDADGKDARLVGENGMRIATDAAPGGRYDIPSRDDCNACHKASPVPVLGASALQLSPLRDEHALHAIVPDDNAVDLHELHSRGRIINLPAALLASPPRIHAPTTQTRAALGYLHGNCGHCHNDSGPLAMLDLSLLQSAGDAANSYRRTLATLLHVENDVPLHGMNKRVVPGEPQSSLVLARLHSSNPYTQMPPIGTSVADVPAATMIETWIRKDVSLKEFANEP